MIIPASAACFPVISRRVTAIDALLIESGARLTIRASGSLDIIGETGRYAGATNLGYIENQGMLIVHASNWPESAIEMAVSRK